MKKILFLLLVLSIISCDSDKYDGMIITDKYTNKQYLLENAGGRNYFIAERKVKSVSGKDTTWAFEY